MSCKNEKKKNEVILNFGLENKVIVDTNLMISDTGIFIHERIDDNEIDTSYFANKDYWFSPCFLDNDTLKIIKHHDYNNYRISIYQDSVFNIINDEYINGLNFVYNGKFISKYILKQRLIINKMKFKRGDTLKINYFRQVKYCFSNRIDTTVIDSLSFECVVINKNTEDMNDFNNKINMFFNLDFKMKHFLEYDFFTDNYIVDSNLQIPKEIVILNNRTGQQRKYLLHKFDQNSCFKKGNNVFLTLKSIDFSWSMCESYLLSLNTINLRYSFDSIHGGCTAYDVTFYKRSKHRIVLNKHNFAIGDTLKCKAYFLNKVIGMQEYYYNIDSIYTENIVNPYTKNIHQELLSKFPK